MQRSTARLVPLRTKSYITSLDAVLHPHSQVYSTQPSRRRPDKNTHYVRGYPENGGVHDKGRVEENRVYPGRGGVERRPEKAGREESCIGIGPSRNENRME